MAKTYRLTNKGGNWHVMARKGAGEATDAAWLTLGGCPSHIIAMRVYLALKAREGR